MVQFNSAWLIEWFDGVMFWTPYSTVELLPSHGFEAEQVEAGLSDKVVVGYVQSCVKHPEADKLNVCTVDVGAAKPLTIVCGCPTVKEGIKVCCALIGAQIGDLTIAQRALRGVTSQGMLCSMQELGLKTKSKGIWHLDNEAPVGELLSSWLRASDTHIAVEVTPNRGDVMSVRGLAREIALASSFNYNHKPWSSLVDLSSLPSTLEVCTETDDCEAFHLVKLDGVANVRTPDYIACRLLESGVSLHNVLVDIANYVMLETGQPLHTYDADKVAGDLTVGYLQKSTSLALLNGDEVDIDDKTLVVKSEGKPVCVAGYMGGAGTQVDNNTKSVYVEAALFNAVSVAHTCRKYPYHTHSGTRFERGIDSGYVAHALERAVSLIMEITGAKAVGYSAIAAKKSEQVVIEITHNYFKKMLGFVPDIAKYKEILERAGFAIDVVQDAWLVTPPSWRNEVHLACHVLSECVRLGSLLTDDDSTTMGLQIGTRISCYDKELRLVDRMRDTLVAQGWFETLSYSFASEIESKDFLRESDEAVALSNPLMQSMAMMRSSLWSGLLLQARGNKHIQQHNIKLFEVGRCFRKNTGGVVQQPRVLAMLMSGGFMPESWRDNGASCDFYYAKSVAHHLLSAYVKTGLLHWVEEAVVGLHPHQSGAYYYKGQKVVELGVIHPKLAKQYDVAEDTCLFEIGVDCLAATLTQCVEAKSTVYYPTIRRDLSLIVPISVSFELVRKKIELSLTNYLKDFVLFDIYSGSQVTKGNVSYSLGFVFQHDERSLSDDDVQPMMDLLIKEFDTIGVSIRGG